MSDVNESVQKLIGTFMRHSMHRFITFSKERGLSMSQMGTLMMLHRHGPCAVSDIGEHLDISAAASSQLLNQLVDENLIERQEDSQDRRVKRIALTKQGMQTIKKSTRAQKSWLHKLTVSLTKEEQEQVSIALNLLLEKSNQLTETKKHEEISVHKTH